MNKKDIDLILSLCDLGLVLSGNRDYIHKIANLRDRLKKDRENLKNPCHTKINIELIEDNLKQADRIVFEYLLDNVISDEIRHLEDTDYTGKDGTIENWKALKKIIKHLLEVKNED